MCQTQVTFCYVTETCCSMQWKWQSIMFFPANNLSVTKSFPAPGPVIHCYKCFHFFVLYCQCVGSNTFRWCSEGQRYCSEFSLCHRDMRWECRIALGCFYALRGASLKFLFIFFSININKQLKQQVTVRSKPAHNQSIFISEILQSMNCFLQCLNLSNASWTPNCTYCTNHEKFKH